MDQSPDLLECEWRGHSFHIVRPIITVQPTNQSNHSDDEAPNPYCVVTVGKQSYKSKKKTKTFHPSWSNATFVLYVHNMLVFFFFSNSLAIS
jgi:hypothetical protein